MATDNHRYTKNRPPSICASETDCAYLAGIIDGEGTIGCASRKVKWRGKSYQYLQIRMAIYNCDPRLVEWVVARFGGGFSTWRRKNGTHRPLYSWLGLGLGCRHVLLFAEPYMVLKKRQAELALEFMSFQFGRKGQPKKIPESVWRRRLEIQAELRQLNRRGQLVLTGQEEKPIQALA